MCDSMRIYVPYPEVTVNPHVEGFRDSRSRVTCDESGRANCVSMMQPTSMVNNHLKSERLKVLTNYYIVLHHRSASDDVGVVAGGKFRSASVWPNHLLPSPMLKAGSGPMGQHGRSRLMTIRLFALFAALSHSAALYPFEVCVRAPRLRLRRSVVRSSSLGGAKV